MDLNAEIEFWTQMKNAAEALGLYDNEWWAYEEILALEDEAVCVNILDYEDLDY